MHPGAEGSATIELIQTPVGLQKSLLQRILGQYRVTEQARTYRMASACMGLEQTLESPHVATATAFHQG
jgi:hypothetical protein